MKVDYKQLFISILRIGYVSGLLLVIIPINLIALIDIYRYAHLGLSIKPALQLSIHKSIVTYGFQAAIIVLFFVILIPNFVAITRIASHTSPKRSGLLSTRSAAISISYIILGLLLGFLYILSKSFEITSGYKNLPFDPKYNFSSWLSSIMDFGGFATIRILSLILVIVYPVLATIIAEVTKQESNVRKWLASFASRVNLADLNREFYPVHGRHRLNFNAASVAPSIRFVTSSAQKKLKDYQKKIPGTEEAAECLEDTWKRSKELLCRLMGLDSESENLRISLFSGTSRAFEAILRVIPGNKKIILSPYEHPTELCVVNWIKKTDGYDLHKIQFNDLSLWESDCSRQSSFLIEEIMNSLSAERTNIIVISEVCYATGLVIPVNQIISEVSRRISYLNNPNNLSLKFIIDGAHAVGNIQKPKVTLSPCEAYIFSGHKWLMAPEPCGLVISLNSNSLTTKAYDCWDNNIPTSTSGAAMIMGLWAGLNLLESITVNRRWSRSQELRNQFIRMEKNTFATIGEKSGLEETCMLSIKPRTGSKWRWNSKNLREYLYKVNAVNVEVIDHIDRNTPWVRISFPYFLDSWEIDKICRILNDAIE